MLNRDIFVNDPIDSRLANNGVAQVKDDQSEGALTTLEYELRTFVCDGAYQEGLSNILNNFLSAVKNGGELPGVWISGFFGSGKSHLAKMLRTLWTNQTINGVTARSIADLPDKIAQQFEELSALGASNGGLHAASGTLSAGASDRVRLALLDIIFKSAGLPEQYHQARFVMWLKAQGALEQVQEHVKANAKRKEGVDLWLNEVKNLHVSPILHNAVLDAIPGFASDIKEVREMMRAQYPIVKDVTNDEMVDAITDALGHNGELPLTLVVLDEVQQYIGDNIQRALDVQEIVETCCGAGALKSKLLFVATGQSALTGMTNLQRLMGRFQLPVQLEDTDVDKVIRKVILQKKASATGAVQTVLNDNLGEISRHLRGSTIEHNKDDEQWMVPDYPLLPVRRRFWEKVLPAIDRTGTGSQLRNQLRVVHEALKVTADKELGYVVPADYLYDQISTSLLQTGVISKDIYEDISRKKGGTEEQRLQGRILALILLIGKLPEEKELGIYSTEETLADLLLEDLDKDKHTLRPLVPKMLAQLESEHLVMSLDTAQGRVYHLQTVESQAWYDELRRQENDLLGNLQNIESYRTKEIQNHVRKQVNQAMVNQGETQVPRSIQLYFELELLKNTQNQLCAWAPEQTEKQFLDAARGADQEDATIFIYVPESHRSELRKAIVTIKAAENTVDVRGRPNTEAGKDAMKAITTRQQEAENTKNALLKDIYSRIQVRLAGGQEVEGLTLTEQVQAAGKLACERLYSKFKIADSKGWDKVYDSATEHLDPNALAKLGYNGEPDKHPVCAEILRFVGTMKFGKEVQENFERPPFGWSKDTIQGAVCALAASGVLKVADGQENAVSVKELRSNKWREMKFRPEKVSLSKVQMIKVRGIVSALLEKPCNNGEEAAKLPEALAHAKRMADQAGGGAPLPPPPSTSLIAELQMYSGNEQLQKAYENQQQLIDDFQYWNELQVKIAQRQKDWAKLQQALKYCKGLQIHEALNVERRAIIDQRSLLTEPNPVSPLLKDASSALRDALTAHRSRYEEAYKYCLQELEADEHWQKLDEAKRHAFLFQRRLDSVPDVQVSTLDEAFDSLDAISFEQWNDKAAALPGLFDALLKDAINELLPKTKYHKLNKRVINNEEELKEWLDYVEQELRQQLINGPVMPS